MRHPADQIFSLAKANGQLALQLAEIFRSSNGACLQAASKVLLDATKQAGELRLGTMPSTSGEAVKDLLEEAERNRDNFFAQCKSAVDDWQNTCANIVGDSADPQAWVGVMQGWFTPFSKSVGAGSEKASASKRS